MQGTKFLAGAWGKAPNVTPRPQIAKRKKKSRGSEATPDGLACTQKPSCRRKPVTPFRNLRTRPARAPQSELVRPKPAFSGCSATSAPSMIRLARLTAFLGDLGGMDAQSVPLLSPHAPAERVPAGTCTRQDSRNRQPHAFGVYHDPARALALDCVRRRRMKQRWGGPLGLPWGCHPIPRLGTQPQTPSPLRGGRMRILLIRVLLSLPDFSP